MSDDPWDFDEDGDEPGSAAAATIQARFEVFHRENPWVYRELVRLTTDLVAHGRTRFGIGMLWEVLRWHYYLTTSDPNSDFKLNDHYRSRYVRLIIAEHPELEDYFETRVLRAP